MSRLPTATLHTFSGNHYEIGVQQGQAIRKLLHNALREMPNFESVKGIKPKLLPTPLFLALAKRRATKLLQGNIFQFYPKQAQRLRGIAEGAGIDIPTLLFMQSLELVLGQKSESSYRLQACTCLGFGSQRTKTGEVIVAKNFDYPPEIAPFHLTCHLKPTEGYQTLSCTMAPLPSTLEGMNEHGLTVAYNYIYTTDKPKHYVPLSMALQEMLETCRNTDEAVTFITQSKRAGSALLTLADAKGNIKTVEISPNYASVRDMTEGHVVNTNSYFTSEMQRHEIPHNAVYFGKAPKALHGMRVHESSEQRLRRAQELLKGKAKVDENKIIKVLRDHGRDNKPSMFTICRHSEFGSTIRSVIFHPQKRTVKVLYGNPCQNEYTQFTL
jgi:predicted choloylglycine hydrolase